MAASITPNHTVTMESTEPRAASGTSFSRAYLWDSAFSKLELTDPVSSRFLKDQLSPQPSFEIIKLVIDSANEKQMQRAESRWQISFRKNGVPVTVNFRDKAIKIIECFVEYKGYVDKIVDFDPTGYGKYIAFPTACVYHDAY
jgi:hypothetical protein